MRPLASEAPPDIASSRRGLKKSFRTWGAAVDQVDRDARVSDVVEAVGKTARSLGSFVRNGDS